jgi:UDP-2-acetamido-3-amino-2,3-dideoxy-glucuronate N-acetyltransferase
MGTINVRLHKTTSIHPKAQIATNVTIGKYTEISRQVIIEEGVVIGDRCKLGFDDIANEQSRISQNPIYETFLLQEEECIIKKGTVIHDGAYVFKKVLIGEDCSIGNNSFIRSNSQIGSHVVIGFCASVGPFVRIGDHSQILQFSVIGSASSIGKSVFISPSVVLADNKYMLRTFSGAKGPVIEDFVRIGALSVIISCRIGRFSLIGAHSVVAKDVPEKSIYTATLSRKMPTNLIEKYMESLK